MIFVKIDTAINWAKKHNLKIVIVGGRDSWMNTDLLIRENIPVILTTIQTTPRRRHEPIHLPYKVPSLLQKAEFNSADQPIMDTL